jgi:hypothetical protein
LDFEKAEGGEVAGAGLAGWGSESREGKDVLEAVFEKGGPVGDGTVKVAAVDIGEWVGKGPFIFDVGDLEC